METIEFQNREFKVREISLPEFGDVLISTDSLNQLLLKDGSYVSDEAIKIDEQIFYFVNENEIELSEKRLKKLVSKQLI